MARVHPAAVAAAVTIAVSAAFAGSARASAQPGTYPFYDCTGPAGTPSSFTATKENLPGSAAHDASGGVSYLLTDATTVFVVQEFGATTIAPGTPHSNLVVSCEVDLPAGTFTFTGFLVPRVA